MASSSSAEVPLPPPGLDGFADGFAASSSHDVMCAPCGLETTETTPDADALAAETMPVWTAQNESKRNVEAMFFFHSQSCDGFANGYCEQHQAKKNKGPCFMYHFGSQRRRLPVDAETGQLRYWDVPCPSEKDGSAECPNGDACIYSHGRDEVSYHPGKYKTRQCNGRGCRGEAVCCFAHGEQELRYWAAERYSYVSRLPHAAAGDANGRSSLSSYLGKTKSRFCASFPNVGQCRRGASCAFAHSREECRADLLSEAEEKREPYALTEDFFMMKFKTRWCPIGVQHDWQSCVYAHNYQDARRPVEIGYGPKPCPYYKRNSDVNYKQRCPLGLRCPFSHGAKEQLYHPQYFRSVICRDLQKSECPRKELCAFFHHKSEKHKPRSDYINYDGALPQENLPAKWVADFLAPPYFPEKGDPADEDIMQMAMAPKAGVFNTSYAIGTSSFGYPCFDLEGMAKGGGGDNDTPRTESTSVGSDKEVIASNSSRDEAASTSYAWNSRAKEFRPLSAPWELPNYYPPHPWDAYYSGLCPSYEGEHYDAAGHLEWTGAAY